MKLKGDKIMSANEITTKIESLRELEELIEEAKAEAETLRDEIKAEMLNRNIEEMTVGQYIIRWTSILSNRFDTTGFKRAYGDLYKAYTKQTASRRFTISV
jgi:predicted phage-related endonuclease